MLFARRLLDKAPVIQTDDTRYREEPALNYLVPDDPNVGYDMTAVIEKVVDRDSIFEIMPTYAKNIICAFARMEGRTVAIVANNPLHLAGCLDIDASVKVKEFAAVCTAPPFRRPHSRGSLCVSLGSLPRLRALSVS